YYTASNGQGTMLNANDVISDSQTIYVFAQNGICSAESSFVITITPTPVVPTLNDVAVCESYTLPALANGNYYTASNGQGTMLNANDVIANSQTVYIFAENGICANESSFTVTVTALDAATTLIGATITATQIGVNYQWVDCDNSNAVIVGATEQSYTPEINGHYAVVISSGDCAVTSECVAIDTLGTGGFELSNAIAMYPNPTKNLFTVDTGNLVADDITVFDNVGRLIMTRQPNSNKTVFDVSGYAEGVYYVKIKHGNQETTKKLVLRY
ncbi:MAG: T9SS type A sorting domain-containing protein, partial [Flavobacterium sp.]|nr:T9SS type A sorting domain-containing protein [Flavobacterium sp.]